MTGHPAQSAEHTGEQAAAEATTPASADEREVLLEEIRSLRGQVTALEEKFDKVIPQLVQALRRDQYFDEMQGQLRRAERVSEAWRDWPLVLGVHETVLGLRSTPDADRHLLASLEDLLYRAGIEEYGHAGEEVDPVEVEVMAWTGDQDGTVLEVEECKIPGLRVGAVPLRKPKVVVRRKV